MQCTGENVQRDRVLICEGQAACECSHASKQECGFVCVEGEDEKQERCEEIVECKHL